MDRPPSTNNYATLPERGPSQMPGPNHNRCKQPPPPHCPLAVVNMLSTVVIINVAPGCGFNHPMWLNQLENTYSLFTISQAPYIITTPSTPSPHHTHLTPTPVCLPFPPLPLPLHAHSELDVLVCALSPSMKLKGSFGTLESQVPRGAFTLLGPDSIYQILFDFW